MSNRVTPEPVEPVARNMTYEGNGRGSMDVGMQRFGVVKVRFSQTLKLSATHVPRRKSSRNSPYPSTYGGQYGSQGSPLSLITDSRRGSPLALISESRQESPIALITDSRKVSQQSFRSGPFPTSEGQYDRGDGRPINFADTTDSGLGVCGWILTICSLFLVGLTFPFSLMFCIKVVQEYERAVIFRLGRLLHGGAKGPGIFFILPCIEHYTKVDLRTLTFDVPPQEVLTKDSVTVSVDAVVYYRVHNATVSVANVENAHHSTRLLAQTTLRNMLGTHNLHEILSDRESISSSMQKALAEPTSGWGIRVERTEIKDVRLPVQLQRAMAAEAEAAREARAKVIAAEGEQKASRALKEAADVISESPAAIQLRYLQTLNTISAEKNSTIIFPLPIDFLSNFINRKPRADE